MLRLTQTEEFKTIISSCSTNEQEQKASENFMKRIIDLCDAEDDAISLFRILRYTRFRLQTFQAVYLMDGRGKNVSELLCVIDTELKLLKMRMQGFLSALPANLPRNSVGQVKQPTWSNFFTPLTPATALPMERLA